MLETDVEVINRLHEEGLAAVNAGDVARIMNLWTEDALRMPPNEPAAIGKASIEAQYRAMFDELTTDLHVQTETTDVSGNWAYSRWTCAGTLAPKAGGKPVREEFKCVDIFRKQQDGTWKMTLHIWNGNEPLPTSEANKALVRRFYEEGLNKRNMTIVDELLDPYYVYHGVVEGEIKGVEAEGRFALLCWDVTGAAEFRFNEAKLLGTRSAWTWISL
jgi:uncharacterized protein (TIGR02246 family)